MPQTSALPTPPPAAPPSDAYTAYRDRRFFTALDGLRAFAILAVIWQHSGAIPFLDQVNLGETTVTTRLLTRGLLGVDLFFAISGFLIVTLLLRERQRSGGISLRGFYKRRSLRIFPIYYATLLALTALYLLGPGPGDPDTRDWLAGLTPCLLYITNFWVPPNVLVHHTWTLSQEEQFYFLWAPVEKYLKKIGVYVLLAVVIGLSLAMNFGVFDAAWGNDWLSLLGISFLPLALGVVLAHLLHHRETFGVIRRLTCFPGGSTFYAVVILLLAMFCGNDLRGFARPTIHVAMILLLAALVIRETAFLNRLLRLRPLARMGVVSYGMYLFHPALLEAVRAGAGKLMGSELPPFVHFVVATAVIWIAAELSYRFFETRFSRRRVRNPALSPGQDS